MANKPQSEKKGKTAKRANQISGSDEKNEAKAQKRGETKMFYFAFLFNEKIINVFDES